MLMDNHNHDHYNHYHDHEHSLRSELFHHLPYAIFSVAFALGILILYYFDFIHVQYATIKSTVGLQEYHSFREVGILIEQKMYEHWMEIILVVIAAFVGFKLG